MSLRNHRVVAVVVGGAVIVGLGATGAVAGKLIGSAQIANNSVSSVDLKNGDVRGVDLARDSVASGHIRNGSVGLADLSTAVKDAIEGEPVPAPAEGISGLVADSLAAPVTIATIGGPINANNTDLDTGLTLPAGRYLVTVDGAFISSTADTSGVDVYPQLSLWIDEDDNDAFAWQTEGDISPNALMPTAANRHIAVSGSTIVELDAETYVGLLGFGYDAAQGSARSGEIQVRNATITATPLS